MVVNRDVDENPFVGFAERNLDVGLSLQAKGKEGKAKRHGLIIDALPSFRVLASS